MLSIEIGKAYYNKELFIENSYLHLKTGAITTFTNDYHIVTKALSYENSYAVKYVVHDVEVSQLSLEERKEFFRKHIGIVRENKPFIHNLNILGYIELQKSLFNIEDCNKWIDFLGLNECLNKYPSELNVFETFSFNILLELIKNPEVLIIEYFEDQLDYLQTQIILNTLRAFCNQDRIVIVSSNNLQVINLSDEVYDVRNHKIECEKRSDFFSFKNSSISKDIKIAYKKIIKKLHQLHFKNHTLKSIVKVLLCIAFALSAFVTNYDNGVQKLTLTSTNYKYNGLYIYKDPVDSIVQAELNWYESHDGGYVPLTTDEVIQVSNIKHVEAVEWSYIYHPHMNYQLNDGVDDSQIFIQLTDGQVIDYHMIDNDGNGHVPSVSTYNSSKDYIDFVDYKLLDKGVYISEYLMDYIYPNMDYSLLEGATITFYMQVPIYNSYGKTLNYVGYGDGPLQENPYCTSYMSIEVTLPISGIMQHVNYHPMEILYVERGYVESLISEYKANASKTIYVLENEVIIDTLPEDGKYVRVATDTPWQPTGYIVYVDNFENMGDVISELLEMGFSVRSPSFMIDPIVETNHISKTYVYIGIAISVILIMIVYILSMFKEMKLQKEIDIYLKTGNFTNIQIIKLKQHLYVYNTKKTIINSSFILLFNILVWNTVLRWGYTDLSLSMFVIIIVLSILFEFIIPYLCDRATILKK